MATLATPGPDLVMQGWLKTVCGTVGVASRLPNEWSDTLFVTTLTILTQYDAYSPLRNAAVQVNVWGQRGSTHKAPYRQTSAFAEALHDKTLYLTTHLIPAPSAAYRTVRLGSIESEGFLPVEEEPSLAHFAATMRITYVPSQD